MDWTHCVNMGIKYKAPSCGLQMCWITGNIPDSLS